MRGRSQAARPLPAHPTHYERLGVPETATAGEIHAAWQAMAPTLPPEQPMAPNLVTPGVVETEALRAAAVRLAYRVLSQPGRRAVYDRWLAAERGAQQAARGWWQRLKLRLALGRR